MLRTKSATATGQKSILAFLQKADVDYDTEDEMNDGGKIIKGQDDEEIVGDKFTMQEAIDHLNGFEAKITRNANDDKKHPLLKWQIVQAMAVLRLLQKHVDGEGKMEASADIARMLYGTSGECYKARSIRYWAEEYLKTGELVTYKQGKHAKVYSIITFYCKSKIKISASPNAKGMSKNVFLVTSSQVKRVQIVISCKKKKSWSFFR